MGDLPKGKLEFDDPNFRPGVLKAQKVVGERDLAIRIATLEARLQEAKQERDDAIEDADLVRAAFSGVQQIRDRLAQELEASQRSEAAKHDALIQARTFASRSIAGSAARSKERALANAVFAAVRPGIVFPSPAAEAIGRVVEAVLREQELESTVRAILQDDPLAPLGTLVENRKAATCNRRAAVDALQALRAGSIEGNPVQCEHVPGDVAVVSQPHDEAYPAEPEETP